jgi:hypothetical protein
LNAVVGKSAEHPMQYRRPQEPDHGLPLIQLKERRRELVIALLGRPDLPTTEELMEIAAIQHSISAFEDVIADLDTASDPAFARPFLVSSRLA